MPPATARPTAALEFKHGALVKHRSKQHAVRNNADPASQRAARELKGSVTQQSTHKKRTAATIYLLRIGKRPTIDRTKKAMT